MFIYSHSGAENMEVLPTTEITCSKKPVLDTFELVLQTSNSSPEKFTKCDSQHFSFKVQINTSYPKKIYHWFLTLFGVAHLNEVFGSGEKMLDFFKLFKHYKYCTFWTVGVGAMGWADSRLRTLEGLLVLFYMNEKNSSKTNILFQFFIPKTPWTCEFVEHELIHSTLNYLYYINYI